MLKGFKSRRIAAGNMDDLSVNPFVVQKPVWCRFDDGGGSGDSGGDKGGDDGGKGDGGGQGSKNADDGGKKSDGSGGDGSKGDKPFAVFPDAASFNARMDRATKSQLETMAKELGFENVDAMKSAAQKAKEIEDQNKSELEKEREARQKAEKQGKAAIETANTRLINADIKVFASQAGFADPSDAIALIDRADIKVDDAGNVTGAKEAVDALAKSKPHLLSKGDDGQGGKGAGDTGGGTGDKGGFDMNSLIRRAAGRK